MRLIDADALPKYTGYALSADEVAMAVENAPTIDAVPVVRCKDCMFYTDMDDRERARYCPDPDGRFMLLDGFCACGERKNNEQN